MNIDPDYLIQTLTKLVQTNSINPMLSTDGPGETEIAEYTAVSLQSLGLETTKYEIAPNRWNVVGRLPGKGNGRSLLLNAHMDTVGVTGMKEDPFSAEIRDGKLYGRGSYDMKASLAAMMAAAKALVDGGVELAGDLLVTAVADEEYASIGMDHLVKTVTADAAIVTEPTDLQLCRAHRGFIWYDIDSMGRAAHGSRYQEGIDANMRMGRFLAKLDELEKELRQRTPHPLAGPPSLHASKIHGGTEISIYAAHCHLELERRTIPGETVAQATAELQTIIDQLAAADETVNMTVKPTFQRSPFEVAEDAPISQTVAAAIENKLGTPAIHMGQTFWTDAAILSETGIETVLVGPTGHGLHSAVEWVDVQSTIDLAYILAETAVHYCG
ncbi:MAG: M20/M25/M40 family metallo-hydrolase [Chloroflexi bacterium]|nr:MAG: M20/M25/M40 family metallo-hydrolase [Chloroflexota bacterium]